MPCQFSRCPLTVYRLCRYDAVLSSIYCVFFQVGTRRCLPLYTGNHRTPKDGPITLLRLLSLISRHPRTAVVGHSAEAPHPNRIYTPLINSRGTLHEMVQLCWGKLMPCKLPDMEYTVFSVMAPGSLSSSVLCACVAQPLAQQLTRVIPQVPHTQRSILCCCCTLVQQTIWCHMSLEIAIEIENMRAGGNR